MEALDAWAEKHGATRSEAIRRLVGIGLSKFEQPKRPKVLSTTRQSAARPVEPASDAIDKHSDQNASTDERKDRKKALIQGPSGFRARKDRPEK